MTCHRLVMAPQVGFFCRPAVRPFPLCLAASRRHCYHRGRSGRSRWPDRPESVAGLNRKRRPGCAGLRKDNTYVDFVRDGLVGDGAARAGNALWRGLTEVRAMRGSLSSLKLLMLGPSWPILPSQADFSCGKSAEELQSFYSVLAVFLQCWCASPQVNAQTCNSVH